MTAILRVLVILVGVFALPLSAASQTAGLPASSVLIIDSDRLFAESAFGKRVIAERQAEVALLAAEYRRIEAELSEEERALTEQRPSMSPEDFRKVADAFDERVESIRATQEQREVDLAQQGEAERQRFISLLRPVFQAILSESGAVVVLEQRSVFASSSALDVTDRVISQADLMLGDGTEDDTDTQTDEN